MQNYETSKFDLQVQNFKLIIFFFRFLLVVIFSTPFTLLLFTIANSGLPENLSILISNYKFLNCSKSHEKFHNIPCIYIDELKNFSYFGLNYENLMDKNFYATLNFTNPGEFLSCDDAFDNLDIFEMENPFLKINFNEENFLNDIYKNFFLLAYQRMTQKIFKKCEFDLAERSFNVMDINDEEIEMKYNRSGFLTVAFL